MFVLYVVVLAVNYRLVAEGYPFLDYVALEGIGDLVFALLIVIASFVLGEVVGETDVEIHSQMSHIWSYERVS